jgi:hypothetical protein
MTVAVFPFIIEVDGGELVMETDSEPGNFELRIYTLTNTRALDFRKDEIYPRHLKSSHFLVWRLIDFGYRRAKPVIGSTLWFYTYNLWRRLC